MSYDEEVRDLRAEGMLREADEVRRKGWPTPLKF